MAARVCRPCGAEPPIRHERAWLVRIVRPKQQRRLVRRGRDVGGALLSVQTERVQMPSAAQRTGWLLTTPIAGHTWFVHVPRGGYGPRSIPERSYRCRS